MLPASRARHSLATLRVMAAARDACAGEQPNMRHLPTRADTSLNHLLGGSGGGGDAAEDDDDVE